MKNTTVHKLKNSKNHPVYEDTSDSRRKVVIVRRTLIETLESEQFLGNLVYVILL